MTLLEVLGTLRREKIELRPDGGALRFRPVCRVSGMLRAALSDHKSALLLALDGRALVYAGPSGAPLPGEWVKMPDGIGELVGWAENGEALVYLFKPARLAGPGATLIWAQAERVLGELEWSATA
ncbi:MAG: hypothetical protein ACREJM_15680 [Candidatus Saccharimonadales bacterium]